jgi:hypothetical protein
VDGRRYWESPTIDRSGMIINRARADLGADEQLESEEVER